MEEGNITLIAATVENPFFYVNSALLSRSQVFELKPLLTEEILKILNRALTDRERGLGNLNISPERGSLEHMAKMADGDARKALSALEIAALTTHPAGRGGYLHSQCAQRQFSLYGNRGSDERHRRGRDHGSP